MQLLWHKKGFIPLAGNEYGGISWQGERLADFWMWNRQFIETAEGRRLIQAVKVEDLKEAAIRYWRDGWVPLRPIEEGLLRRMEGALRSHRGLQAAGVVFPDGPFLESRDVPPAENLSDEARAHIENGK